MEQNIYNGQLSNAVVNYTSYMSTTCIDSADERFRVRYLPGEYIYTLYYYDQAGNLIKTVPPEGVVAIGDTVLLDSVSYYRLHGGGYIHPEHGLISGYKFNSMQQTVHQGTPDADTTSTWYDVLGRIAVSQSAEQRSRSVYSYTLYDALSRIIEVGEIGGVDYEMVQDSAYIPSTLSSWISSGTRSQITKTFFDQPVKNRIPTPLQMNLRGRVAAVTFSESNTGVDSLYNSAIHYSYDIHGNVSLIVQDIPVLTYHNRRYTRTDYSYDLVSGKVNMIVYQKGLPDCFMHKYLYDADNRITHVFVSKDGKVWERDAKYFYYPNASLARTEIGDRQVQATDQLYTLQGWIKGINSNTLYDYRDPGKDAVYDTSAGMYLNANFAMDAASYSLNYFTGDYQPVAGMNNDSLPLAINDPSTYTSLYNGNISAMVTHFLAPDTTSRHLPDTLSMMLKSYRYDCLNRLKTANSYTDTTVAQSNEWTSPVGSSVYYEGYAYDRNGNITQLQRYSRAGSIAVEMDSLHYHYNQTDGMLINNQLLWVDDRVSQSRHIQDIDDQDTGNYVYNENGSLIHDEAGQLATITWNPYGKITAVIPDSGSGKQRLDFGYDPMGNRVMKKVQLTDDTSSYPVSQYYMRDAQGNILSVYSLYYDTVFNRWQLKNIESHIYGSARLGIDHRDVITGLYVGNMLANDSLTLISGHQDTLDIVIEDVVAEIIDGFQSAAGDTSQLFIELDSVHTIIKDYGKLNYMSTYTIEGDCWLKISGTFVSASEFISRIPPNYFVFIRKKTVERELGNKEFELTNHLGNVISTVSDRKLSVEDPDSAMYTAYYAPKILTAQDYYAFGMMMPGNTYSIDDTIVMVVDTTSDTGYIRMPKEGYRFGFNGKEKVNEVYGDGNAYDFGARIYDPRVGRWLSMDVLYAKYPNLTPYAFSADAPILIIDVDGRDIFIAYKEKNETTGKTSIQKVKYVNGTLINEDGTEYKGNNEFIMEAFVALEYTKNNSSQASQILTEMETNSASFTINQIKSKYVRYSTETKDNNNNIYWNPYLGISTGYKGRQGILSPGLTLIHELIHGYLERIKGMSFSPDDIPNNRYYEDEYLVEFFEQVICKQLRNNNFKEGYRNDYMDTWSAPKVLNSTSTTSNPTLRKKAGASFGRMKKQDSSTQSKNTRHL